MPNRFAVVLVVVGCSSNPPPKNQPVVSTIAVQRVAAFRAATPPMREPTAAWTLTASDGSGLRLAAVEARAVIEGPLAFTELHLRFHNPENRIREGTFAITLPSRAAISRFAMQEGDRMKEAEVVPKALARRAYDDFLHQRIDPALLEKAAGNQFTARVFPIPANGDKHIVLAYSQELTSEGYVLPLRGLPRIDKVDVSLRAIALDGAWRTQTLAETAWQPDRDFVANLTTTPAVADGTLVAGAFEVVPTFTQVATNQIVQDRPTALTLLVDTSASRALGFTRYLESVRALIGALATRYEGLTIEVIAFDQTTQAIYRGPANAFGEREIAAFVARGPAGASDLSRAASVAHGRTVIVTDAVVTAGLEHALLGKAFAKAERVDIVLAGGIREERVARTAARAGKRAGDVFDLDREAIEPIASGLGETVRVDVPIEVPNATWFSPRTIPSVRDGTRVMVFARLKTPATAFEVVIGGKRWTAPVGKATPALLQRAAARAEIEELEAAVAATRTSDTQTSARLRIEIETKSVAARVISSETTMLVLDTEEDYVRYGIDRKALADILVVGPNGLEQAKRTFFAAKATPRPRDDERQPADDVMALDEGRAGTRSPRDDANAARARRALEQLRAPPVRADARRERRASSLRDRRQAIDVARSAGTLGAMESAGGRFTSLTGTGDISSGFEGKDVYGGLLGEEGSHRATGSSRGFGAGGGGFVVGTGRGGMRARVAMAPAVTLATPVVQGSLDRPIIKRYIRRHLDQISYCYERELLAKPTLEGTVSTQFLIAPGGKVQSVAASGVDEKVATCVADVIKTIEFPTVVDGVVQVNYPFNFRIAGTPRDEATEPAPPPTPAPAPAPVVRVAPAPPVIEPIGNAPISALDGKLAAVMTALAKKNAPGALALATKWRDEQPGDVLAWVGLGEALEAGGDRAGAARAYGSIIDLFGSRAEYRRFAGERLERTGERKLAVDTYRRAVADRPDQLTGHRLLAYALLRDGDHAGAFAAILKGVDQHAPADRYAGAPLVFSRDAGMLGAAYIAAHVEKRDEVMAALKQRSLALVTQPSTRFMLYWETDANDVDLHVRDTNGVEAFYASRTLPSGGELFADVTTGFGPECFEIKGKLPAAPYELAVHYYAQGPMGYGMGLLQIERFDGRRFTFEDRPYVIMHDDAKIALGSVR